MAEDRAKKPLDLQDFFKKLSKRERIVFYAMVFFVILVLLDRILLVPITGRLKFLEESIIQQTNKVKDGLMILGYRDRIFKESELMRDYLASSRKTQEEELAEFLKDVENMAVDSGARLISLSPSGNIENSASGTKYEVKLECRGEMQGILKFMYSLSSARKLAKIESFELTPDSREGKEIKCSMLISRMMVTLSPGN